MKLKNFVSFAEKIGTIGSPSSTGEITLDILATAVEKKLLGELVFFDFNQDGKTHYALGQITEIELKNVWLEDPTMRSLARRRGQVNPISKVQDTHLGHITVSAVFAEDGDFFEPSILGTVPPTGTYIKLANDDILESLLKKYKDEIFYLGYVYGSTPKLPLWFKHFSSGLHGAGEAYHIGIFGKTGSGKSVLAKMILLAYARYKNMSLFVIDPQGEFSKDAKGNINKEGFPLNLKEILYKLNKPLIIKSIRELILDRWELFTEILYESPFFERLTIPKGENRRIASETLSDELNKNKVKLEELYKKSSFEKAWNILLDSNIQELIYRSLVSRERFIRVLKKADKNYFYSNFWKPVAELFRKDRVNAIRINELIGKAFETTKEKNSIFELSRPIVIIDLSKEKAKNLFWNDNIQSLVIKRLFDGITFSAERAYKENKSLNTLVILDEAHKFAYREKRENEKQENVKISLLDAVRTTRKYGLGWLFISQTFSSLHKEIINQLRILFIGFGLALGTEFQALKEFVGGDLNALKLYQSFRDPHSSFDISSRQYSFMTIGPVSPLSFAGTPLFLTVFNNCEEFLKINKFQ